MANAVKRHRLVGEHVYDGILFPVDFREDILDRVKHSFELRDDDILIATFPKSGTTRLLEIVWLVMNDVDTNMASTTELDSRVPFLEIDEVERSEKPCNIDILEEAPSPRIIKTHLPFRFFSKQLTTKKTKLILGIRNLKDTLVSLYYFYKMNLTLGNMTGPFDEFFELFKDNNLAFGDWFDQNLGYWNNRQNITLHLIKFEDLHKDFRGTVKKLADFLGKDLSHAQIDKIARHVSFDNMKGNENLNMSVYPCMKHDISPFMRKGVVGDWKNHFTEEQSKFIDDLLKVKMEGTGLEFDYELV